MYGPTGELVDGGADLSLGGMCSYYHDLIYLAAIVQLASVFTDRIWWSFLLVCNHFPSCNQVVLRLLRHCAAWRALWCPQGFHQKGQPCALALQVPAYALYQLWVSVLQPYVFAPRQKVICPPWTMDCSACQRACLHAIGSSPLMMFIDSLPLHIDMRERHRCWYRGRSMTESPKTMVQEMQHEETPAERKRREKQERKQTRVRYR